MRRTDHPGIVRDERTGMLSDQDTGRYRVILARRREAAERRRLSSRLEALEKIVAEMSGSGSKE